MMNTKKIKIIYIVCWTISVVMILIGVSLCRQGVVESLSSTYARDVAIDAMGLLACGALLLSILSGDKEDKQNRAMFRMIFALNTLFFMDALSSCMEGKPKYVVAIVAVNTLIFIFEDVLGYTYWSYIRENLQLSGRFTDIANKICRTAFFVSIILDLLNIKLGMFFTVSEAGEYIDQPLEFMGDLAIIIVFIIAVVAILHKENITINERLILMTFEAFPFAAYIMGSVSFEYVCIYPAYFISILLIYIRIFAERGKKLAEQQVILTKQGTALMISQIQPHFLYNVLTTISNLCVTDPEEAEETTVLFSQYLRTNLDSLRNQEPVPFPVELGHIRTYVELEKKRFGDILNVEYDIQEQNFNVPSLGLQPIVENSIKHGIRGKNDKGHIKIGTYKVENGYKIIIEDDGIGFDMNQPAKEDGRSHVGMTNVKERLKRMCNASVIVESSPGNGCRTEIIIPE